MYLLATDTLTHLHAGNPRVIDRLQKLEDPDVGITIVTRIELLRGRFDYLLKASTGTELLKAQRLLVHLGRDGDRVMVRYPGKNIALSSIGVPRDCYVWSTTCRHLRLAAPACRA